MPPGTELITGDTAPPFLSRWGHKRSLLLLLVQSGGPFWRGDTRRAPFLSHALNRAGGSEALRLL